jgi:hypothetical protein
MRTLRHLFATALLLCALTAAAHGGDGIITTGGDKAAPTPTPTTAQSAEEQAGDEQVAGEGDESVIGVVLEIGETLLITVLSLY